MKFLLTLIFLICLGGCEVTGFIGSGLQRLYTVIDDDRATEDDIQDFQLNSTIRASLATLKTSLLFDVEVTVFEGQVLLTGTVPNGDVLNHILSTVWSIQGVKKIYNYIRTGASPNINRIADETAIATTIKSKLSLTLGVSSSNYKIMVEHGTIYLMGICSSEEEYSRVQAVLKNTNGIQKIVFLMRLKKPTELDTSTP